VQALKEKDLLDAVGMQMHIIGNANGSANLDPRTPPTKDQLLEQMQRYGDSGLKVFVTELDVDISKLPGTMDERLARQAEIYSTVVRACLESGRICNDLNLWGVNDKETWMGEAALLFNYNQPKPAYYAVLDVLRQFYERKKSL
jgi:GH35 family endo-1,4-beta-xylanase